MTLPLRTNRHVCAHTKKAHPAEYYAVHDQLAREVEAMRASDDHMTRMLAEALALDLEREFG